MKYIKTPQMQVATGRDALEFQNNFNSIMSKLAGQGIRATYEYPDNLAFCCYINYEVEKAIPETCEDELLLNGERYHCADCPNFEPSTDKRVKSVPCKYRDFKVSADTLACEYFCRGVLQNKWRESIERSAE